MTKFTEVDRLLDNIRSSYEDIMVHLPKAAHLKRSFEDRYLDALKNKTDLIFFLKGEQDFLDQFLLEAQEVKDQKESYKERNAEGFAKNVLQEMRTSIADYPELPALNSKGSNEVLRLYGAIRAYLREFWEPISDYMHGFSVDLSLEVAQLERSLADVYSAIESRPPRAVQFYNDLVCSNSSSSSERIRAAQDAIRFAGIWLNNLQHILKMGMRHANDKDFSQNILSATSKLSSIINDFRLGTFAKGKL